MPRAPKSNPRRRQQQKKRKRSERDYERGDDDVSEPDDNDNDDEDIAPNSRNFWSVPAMQILISVCLELKTSTKTSGFGKGDGVIMWNNALQLCQKRAAESKPVISWKWTAKQMTKKWNSLYSDFKTYVMISKNETASGQSPQDSIETLSVVQYNLLDTFFKAGALDRPDVTIEASGELGLGSSTAFHTSQSGEHAHESHQILSQLQEIHESISAPTGSPDQSSLNSPNSTSNQTKQQNQSKKINPPASKRSKTKEVEDPFMGVLTKFIDHSVEQDLKADKRSDETLEILKSVAKSGENMNISMQMLVEVLGGRRNPGPPPNPAPVDVD